MDIDTTVPQVDQVAMDLPSAVCSARLELAAVIESLTHVLHQVAVRRLIHILFPCPPSLVQSSIDTPA